MGLQRGDVTVEWSERCEYQRFFREIARITDEIARCEVVGAIDDDIVVVNQYECIVCADPHLVRLDFYMRVEHRNSTARTLDFRSPDIRRRVNHLPLQVVERHRVVIDDADRAHTRCGKIKNHRRAEPTGADYQHPRGLERLLPLSANFAQHEMPLVSLDFFG